MLLPLQHQQVNQTLAPTAEFRIMSPRARRQETGQFRDLFGNVLERLVAPCSGWILFKETHLFAPRGRLIFGTDNGPDNPE